ncbi:MAG: hypothetical protein QOJ43_1983 [Gaiellaceae bacterium]|nr:hypothetical protein [Gaiellaceae bacterium]
MKLDFLYRGTPGHPLHPPLTDATIGIYTFATVAAVLSKVGIAEQKAAQAWVLALIVGLIVSAPTAITGFADWLQISRGTPLWRTATAHMIAMLFATGFFLIAVGAGYSDGIDGVVTDGAFILTLIGFLTLTVGGWLGGTIVFHYGMRVLNLVEEPAGRATSPIPHPEEEAAES